MAMWLLWISSLAASSLLPATGEVVNSFQVCPQFFLNGKPPNLVPGNPARICQKHNNQYHFATMYDRGERIPMFSAYEYNFGPGGRPTISWMIEPQLALLTAQDSMGLERTSGIPRDILQKSQAVSSDYEDANPYLRGHLASVSHQSNLDDKEATFTLTNAVPKDSKLNNGRWKSYELFINQKYSKGCLHTYVIVGAVPGNTYLKNRVNIPSHIWAAVCCQLPNKRTKSMGVIAENNQKNIVSYISLQNLESDLNGHYGQNNTNLFNSACY